MGKVRKKLTKLSGRKKKQVKEQEQRRKKEFQARPTGKKITSREEADAVLEALVGEMGGQLDLGLMTGLSKGDGELKQHVFNLPAQEMEAQQQVELSDDGDDGVSTGTSLRITNTVADFSDEDAGWEDDLKRQVRGKATRKQKVRCRKRTAAGIAVADRVLERAKKAKQRKRVRQRQINVAERMETHPDA